MIHPNAINNEILLNLRATAAWIARMDADEAQDLGGEASAAANTAPDDGIARPLFVALREVCRTRADAANRETPSSDPGDDPGDAERQQQGILKAAATVQCWISASAALGADCRDMETLRDQFIELGGFCLADVLTELGP